MGTEVNDVIAGISSGGGGGSAELESVTPTLVAGAYTTVSSDLGKLLTVSPGASTGTITLMSAATAGAGAMQYVKKADSAAGRVVVDDGAADLAWLSAEDDIVSLRSDGSAWEAIGWNIAPLKEVFTANGTWTKPPLARALDALVFAGGNGGGSGSRRATGAIRTGGGGGSSNGCMALFGIPANLAGATETVTIGAGGAGGAAVTGDNTDGNIGALGEASSFGAVLIAPQSSTTASAGQPGRTGGNASGGVTPSQFAVYRGDNGALSSSTANAADAVGCVNGGGGAGGASNAANDQRLPSAGGPGSVFQGAALSGGAAGTSGNPGGAGNDADPDTQLGGSGGGGGFYVTGAAGTAGGAGGAPGGGGGGGGAADNGFNSGAGGAGGRGEVRVTTHF